MTTLRDPMLMGPRSPGPRRPGRTSTTRRPKRSRRQVRKQRLAARRTWFGRHPLTTAVAALLIVASPLEASFVSTVTNPGNGSLAAASADWFRSHGGGPFVTWLETAWYSHHQPKVGGKPPKGAIPTGAVAASPRVASVPHLPPPAPIVPPASPPLPGEGQWHPAGRLVHGLPAVEEAFVRPDPLHTSLVAGVAWMDTRLLHAQLYSGSQIPGGGPWHFTAPISPAASQSLVAAFNSGFRMSDAEGGYYSEGKMQVPLVQDDASLVIYADGSVNIGAWDHDVTMTPTVSSVRQNLHLLVDNGTPVPGLNANDTRQWGYTLGNKVFVWRSGLGITANGALVYVGGMLNITDLADLLVRAGAVRGMELDINTDWVNYSVYNPAPGQPASGANGSTLLSQMTGGPSRYFSPDWSRDFVTMSASG